MNEIKIFENPEFGRMRTMEIDGALWFVGKDVALILGYSNTGKAISAHVENDDRQFVMINIADSQNGNVLKGASRTTVINESGLYSLILSSKLPTAKRFKQWVTSEVLPSIRKTGSYSANMTAMEMIAQLADNAVKTERTLADHDKRISELEKRPVFDAEEVFREGMSYSTIDYSQQKIIKILVMIRALELCPNVRDYRRYRDSNMNRIYAALRKKYNIPSYRDILVRDYADARLFIENFIFER